MSAATIWSFTTTAALKDGNSIPFLPEKGNEQHGQVKKHFSLLWHNRGENAALFTSPDFQTGHFTPLAKPIHFLISL